jgi:nucleotide-binding universal stress UspA family protein
MGYATIAVHCDRSPRAAARYALAAQVARATGAHLTGVAATGVSRYAEWPRDPAAPAPLATAREQWRRQAQAALASFERRAAAAGVERRSLYLVDDDPESALLLSARHADLLVLGQADARAVPPGAIRPLPPELLLHAGRPLLLVPAQGTRSGPVGRHPLLAWDGSPRAARAFTDALPLLRPAGRVTLLTLDDGAGPVPHDARAGADLALYLSRHGVRVDVVAESTRADAGSALLRAAAARGCDLLVMGGYGHRRLRETLLGGTTRTVLRDMTLPVLISH